MSFLDNLNNIKKHHQELSQKLSSNNLSREEFVTLSKEYSEYEPIVEKINALQYIKDEMQELSLMMGDKNIDHDLRKMAEEEFYNLKEKLPEQEHELKIALLPKDKADEKNAIIEIRAGTGGDEACLFAGNLMRMYQRYAEIRGWKVEIFDSSETEMGGFKEVSMLIKGIGVFYRLKFESGVHRVQRVPETESSGRIHTSAATVAVLPEAEEFDVIIEEKDLRIDTYRASGAGGQHVNTTDSAVRITHIPTGVVVTQQDEKSQHKNKAKALKILRSRIYEEQRQKQNAERSESRKDQIGSGDRSERIRTYNYPQGRVSDHRINLTLYKIDEIVREGQLDYLIDSLISYDQACKLSEITENKE